MYIPKRYGQSRVDRCPFCDKQATTKNKQGLYVCADHKDKNLPDIKCTCGSYLEMRSGKFGPYFFCMNCGNINLNKGLEMLELTKSPKKVKVRQEKKDDFIIDEGMYPGFDYGIR